MITLPSLRQIMADRESLRRYAIGELPSFDDVKRRLFLLERAQDHRLPDHFYKRGRDHSIGSINTIHGLLTFGLHKLGSEHLELRENRIHVRTESLPAWQDLVTLCSPLVCVSSLLWRDSFRPGMQDITGLADFMREWIEPNTVHTCLQSPRFPFMENLRQNSGLTDLHIHLNGSTETDVAWQVYLKRPYTVSSAIARVSHIEKVKEQMEQEFFCVGGALGFYYLLQTARRLRYAFVHLLFNGRYTPELGEHFEIINTENLLRSGSYAESVIHPSLDHPMRRAFMTEPDDCPDWSEISLESLMYIMIMDRIDATGNNELAACFHYYLLILGLFNRFLVQQPHQCGFDQFQKITQNSFRDVPEMQYDRRFFQLHGNDDSFLDHLEGRFAPKSTAMENIETIRRIDWGWRRFISRRHNRMPRRRPTLSLVCHFIKEADTANLAGTCGLPNRLIRHRILRISLCRKAQVLMQAYEADETVRRYLCGIDAASNELEAPPEVFAPIYRYLRRSGIKHFTYHAGEDFHHLAGGMRAMYEAVEFLDLRRGDRIGHGTAAGIDPVLWLDHVGDEFAMSRGEWLDDLLFVIHLIESTPTPELITKLHLLRSQAIGLAQEVYGFHLSLHSHIQAWLARRHCPLHLLNDLDDAIGMLSWSLDEWRACEATRSDHDVMTLLNLYHRTDCRQRYHEKIKIAVTELLSADDLRRLQDLLLTYLHGREIVLEVLPTSNVRISFYKNHKEHHIWRWLRIGEGQAGNVAAPPVVLGSDDTGIFSTNIYNEYCHVYHHLVQTHHLDLGDAAAVIQRIVENGRVYGFAP